VVGGAHCKLDAECFKDVLAGLTGKLRASIRDELFHDSGMREYVVDKKVADLCACNLLARGDDIHCFYPRSTQMDTALKPSHSGRLVMKSVLMTWNGRDGTSFGMRETVGG
jgi:hypothetical protein